MTDEDRKMLTEEVLGECWHGKTDDISPKGWRMCFCGYALIRPEKHQNRSFTTAQDMMDLKKQIVEMGKWLEFFNHARDFYMTEIQHDIWYTDFTDWLIDEVRFPELVAAWWKERGKE